MSMRFRDKCIMATCKSLSITEILSFYLAFLKLPRIKKQGKLLKKFSQNSVKTALCGVVGSERVWDSSQQAKSVRQAIARAGRFTEMGTRFLCLLRNLSFNKYRKEGKRMDWEPEIKDSGYLPKKGKPTEETVCYKIGGTYYEVSTSCGGSERLRDKMIRLIKSETVKPPNDKQG